MRSTKSALEAEKQMRTTAEFDLGKMRIELAEVHAAKAQHHNQHERDMNDLKYQNEENIKQISLRNDDITELNRQMDALNLTLEARDEHIILLKDSVVEAEIKTRKTMDKLSKIQAGEAQENIDKSIDFLSKMTNDPTR